MAEEGEGEAKQDRDAAPASVKELHPNVEAMFTTVNTAQGRCGLIAGFTYYELSRQGEASVERFPHYVLCLLIAFALAVTSAALATFIRVYARRLHVSEWTEYTSRVSGVVALTYWSFIFASLTWMVAMSMMGMVYNPQAPEWDSETGSMVQRSVMIGNYKFPEALLPMLPFYVIGPTCCLCFVYVMLLCCFARASAIADQRDACGKQYCEFSGVLLKDKSEQIITSVRQSADSTMYLLGFTGAGLARYRSDLTLSHDQNSTVMNISFWFAMVFGAAFLSFTMVCGTHTYVIFSGLSVNRRQFVFSRVGFMRTFLPVTANVGLFLVSISGMWIGWGCSTSCRATYTDVEMQEQTDGCYASVAHVPGIIGGLAVMVTTWLVCKVRGAHRAAVGQLYEEIQALQAQGKSGTEWKTHLTDDGTAVGAMTDSWASQASLFSGFVFYNLACFDTDIIHSPITADFKTGVTWVNVIFLAVTMVSFSFGMTLVTVAGTVNSERQFVVTEGVQFAFVENLKPCIWWLGLLRRLTMYCFMASFALIGFVKMVPARPEPAIITFIGLIQLLAGEQDLESCFKQARELNKHTKVEHLGDSMDKFGQAHRVTHEKTQSQLKVMAPHALFFGAFCYNGVNFLFRPEAFFAPFYATILALCFVTSLQLVLTEGFIRSKFVQLEYHEARKEFFSRKLQYTLSFLYTNYGMVPRLFMGAIILMGPVKLWLFTTTSVTHCFAAEGSICPSVNGTTCIPDPHIVPTCQQMPTIEATDQMRYSIVYGWIIALSGFTGLAGAWLFKHYLEALAEDSAVRAKKDAETERTSSFELDPYEDVKEDAELRTGSVLFQTGNVFYEVLFTVINPVHVRQNYIYIGFSVATLALGCVALVVGGGIAISMDLFPTAHAKSIFAHHVQPCVTLLFVLYYLSLSCWLIAMCASSAVKYEHYWYFSLATSTAALVVIHLGWLVVGCRAKGLTPARAKHDGSDAGTIDWRLLFHPVREVCGGLVSVEGGDLPQALDGPPLASATDVVTGRDAVRKHLLSSDAMVSNTLDNGTRMRAWYLDSNQNRVSLNERQLEEFHKNSRDLDVELHYVDVGLR